MIIRNYATKLIFFAQLGAGPPQRGRPATVGRGDVPIFLWIRQVLWYNFFHNFYDL
jgi:hypothetical protein